MSNSSDIGRCEQQVNKLTAIDNATKRNGIVKAREKNRANRRPIARVGPRQNQQLDDVLVFSEQILVHPNDVGRALTALGGTYQRDPDQVVGGRVVRLVPSTGQRDVGRDVRTLLDNNLRASANHVVVLGGTDKGGVTPDNTNHDLGDGATATEGPLVVVIDTGIDEDAASRTDGWLEGVVPADAALDIDPLHHAGEPDDALDLGAGHGTFVAGVIRQVAKRSNIKVIRALATDGTCSELELAEAIVRAGAEFANTPDRKGILNLSLGFETIDEAEPVTTRAALDALPPDVLVVAAAGNASSGIKLWPAAFDDRGGSSSSPATTASVVAVGSHQGGGGATLTPSTWSNRGDWIKVWARGECVVSTFVTGTEVSAPRPPGPEAVLYDPNPDTFGPSNPLALWTGTSFAAPQVAGALADEWRQNPGATPQQVLAAVLAGGQQSAEHGVLLDLLNHDLT